jgi:hypothetical protein
MVVLWCFLYPIFLFGTKFGLLLFVVFIFILSVASLNELSFSIRHSTHTVVVVVVVANCTY